VSSFAGVLAAWRPGEEGGTAVVDLLTGAANPSGRLSHTWPAKAGQVHSVVATSAELSATNAGQTFRFTTGPAAPLWPLGFGLSYSNFSVDAAAASAPAGGAGVFAPDEAFTVTANVSSSGPAGALVVQVYWQFVASAGLEATTVGRRLVLLCFAKQALPADARGEAVAVECGASGLARGDYAVAEGFYKLSVGQFAGDPRAATVIVRVAGSTAPEVGESMRERAQRFVAERGRAPLGQ
jgi:hypothetical protein